MTDSKEELRPCPFCGAPMKVSAWSDFGKRYGIECRNHERPVMDYEVSYYMKTPEEAIVNWNSTYCWKLLDESRERERKLEVIMAELLGVIKSMGAVVGYTKPVNDLIQRTEKELKGAKVK